MCWLWSHQVAKVLDLQLQYQSFQWIFRVDLLWDWQFWFPCSPRDSQESYPTSQFKSISSLVLSLVYGPTYIRTWLLENYSFDYMDLCRQSDVSALQFTVKFVIAFLLRSKCLLISWLQSPSAVILEPKKTKSVTASAFAPSICHEVMGPDAIISVFWMLSFKSAFSLYSPTLIKRLFPANVTLLTLA